jgi:nucleoid-associated protein YgaU
MGLFDFVKEAGEKIFGRNGKDAPKAEAPKPGFDPAKIEAAKRNQALQQLVAKLGFEVEGLKVSVAGDTATVHGKVDSQAEREKVVLAIGNVVGIAHVDDRMEAVKKEPVATFYTVKSGDTLSKIAKQHYGAASKYPQIFDANRPMLSDPDKIYPGQVLRIPPQATA